MEYAGNMNLAQFIEEHKINDNLIDEDILNNIIRQICLGIKEIHQLNIIHRDIKPENIIYDKINKRIKIGDFGVSTVNKYTIHEKGSYKYSAPEIQSGKKYNNKADIYALGCVLYELFTLNNFYDDFNYGDIKEIDSKYNAKWKVLIKQMLNKKKYHKRPSIEEIISKLD